MVSFQVGTIIIAFIILSVCLVLIAYSLSQVKNNAQYPPVVADCPDYWLDMSDGTGGNCINKHADLGLTSCEKKMDFSKPFWSGELGMCRKKQWAQKCNLTWDGVTNNNHACKKLLNLNK